jgi:hypothetical protein
LKCIRTGGKLRVRITSAGYLNDANCRFPRDLRTDGAVYTCKQSDISLITTRNKYYYMIAKAGIQVVSGVSASASAPAPAPARANAGAGKIITDIDSLTADMSKIKIFEDTSSTDCAICMSAPKNTIINPCGHYYMCSSCATIVKHCPICRGKITGLIDKSLFGTDE